MSSDLCTLLENGGVVSCYLSDLFGTPVNPFRSSGVLCTIEGEREDVIVTSSEGQEVTLQKVWLKNTGYIVVQVTNDSEQCVSAPIPFSLKESAILCAPEGTDIVCTVRDFTCDARIQCQNGVYQSIEISLDFCLDVQVIADVVIEISGSSCHPREQLLTDRYNREGLASHQYDRSFDRTKKNLPQLQTEKSSKREGWARNDLNHIRDMCVNVTKVYDWITQQSITQIRKNADDVPFDCDICALHFFVPAILVCERTLSGTLECNGERVEGASIHLSATPDIVSFSPDPAVTDANGHFTTVVTVPTGTESTDIEINASTTTEGEFVSTTLPTIALCLADPCVLTLFGADNMECNDIISGRVRCNNTFIPDVEVTTTANPAIVTFNPNPAITDELGDYFAGVVIPNGTPPTDVEITTTATVNGETLTETIIVNVSCASACDLTVNADDFITCEGEITGVLTCDGDPVEGAEIEFSTFPTVGTFTPNPATSLADGSFSTTLIVPEETPRLSTVITAMTTVNGQSVSNSVGVHVECLPVDECPCKFRIGISGNAAPASVDIITGGVASTLTGTINVTAVQCFTASASCNPAIDNFNVSFGSGGNTINFITGRRMEIECEGNTFARVRGMARATGNVLPTGIYEVVITCEIGTGGLAVWTVDATDFSGNSFSTSFTANVNPVTFIGDCQDVP
ncbi:hypothetical protein J2T56_001236 [Natronobacillus azotifigens]|uniref:Uncharacterized protein n=1 Tax=Natronobacillus azotifigens TaxID=472978 RepID=A0A9J6RBI6_9BACI|nr:hypothetical protein [Natronobacillus azotifigens]MCZ0703048.1 hypothetical protein [Natronobacillus azotifigens]